MNRKLGALLRTCAGLTIAITVIGMTAPLARATSTPEQRCRKGRYDAAAKYQACQQRTFAKPFGGAPVASKFAAALSKCRVKYIALWSKLQAKASATGATCDAARFQENADGTVTDRLTGLQWERKTDDGGIHDKDDVYSWSTSDDGDITDADGTAFTTFLATLNGGGCFAGQCDWRLPTVCELQTILLEPYLCTTSPCIDQRIFGPMIASHCWLATADAVRPDHAWVVCFSGGSVLTLPKSNPTRVRAVRAGL